MSEVDVPLTIAGQSFQSRLMLGTGKYKSLDQTQAAITTAGSEIVTFAVRRLNIGQVPTQPNLLDYISPEKYTLLPNTAGCFTAKDAILTAEIARELLGGHPWVKLEVLGCPKTLFPDVRETLKAAEILIQKGFVVLVYCTDDPILARHFAQMGCAAVMPLAAPIGSGLGIQNRYNLMQIVEERTVPIIVDAGVGNASDACIAMELGVDGLLMNTAVAEARDPIRMAHAMKHALEAGRASFLAGRMPKRRYANASSPQADFIFE